MEQLHMCFKRSKCVILSGLSGSGKTMAYNTLAAAYQYIRELRALGKSSKTSRRSNRLESARLEYPTVDITVLNPAVYSYDEVCPIIHTPVLICINCFLSLSSSVVWVIQGSY